MTLDHEAKHHLVFANEWVRVFDVIVPAGDSTRYHVHANDYVYVNFGAANLKAQPLGGSATDLRLADGEVRFTPGPITHRVVNPSTTPFHNLTIELLKSTGVTLSSSPAGQVVLDNSRVRVERIVLEPGESTPRHEHRGPGLEVAVRGGTVSSASVTEVSQRLTYQSAGYRWYDAPRIHTLTNVGPTTVEIVEIEWR